LRLVEYQGGMIDSTQETNLEAPYNETGLPVRTNAGVESVGRRGLRV
jgi:hypothetical protein